MSTSSCRGGHTHFKHNGDKTASEFTTPSQHHTGSSKTSSVMLHWKSSGELAVITMSVFLLDRKIRHRQKRCVGWKLAVYKHTPRWPVFVYCQSVGKVSAVLPEKTDQTKRGCDSLGCTMLSVVVDECNTSSLVMAAVSKQAE